MTHQAMQACSGCDLLLEKQQLPPGQAGFCPRCGSLISAPRRDSVNRTLAISVTGLLLYFPAMFFPLLSLGTMGLEGQGSIVDGFFAFYSSGYKLVAIVVLLTSVLLPLAKLVTLFLVSFCIFCNFFPPFLSYLLRTYHHLKEWGMDEVYLIGLFVTLIKVYDIAEIQYEIGFFTFLGLVLTTVGLSLVVDMEHFWQRIEQNRQPLRTGLSNEDA